MNNPASLKISTLIGVCGRSSGSAATLLSTVLLSRMLTTREFGEYMVLMTVMLIGSLLGALGMGEAILRFAGARLGGDDAGGAWAVCVRCLSWAGGGLLVVGAVLLAGYESIRHVVPLMPVKPTDVALTSLWLFGSGLVLVLSCALRSFDRIALGTLAEITLLRVGLLGVLGILYVANVRSLTAALGASAWVAVGVAVWAGWMLRRVVPAALRRGDIDLTGGDLLRFALPLLGSNVLFRFMSDASLWFVSAACTSDDVAFYGAAYRLWVVFSLPQVAINATIQGQIARRHAAGDLVGLEKLMRGATMMAFWPTLAITAVVCLAGGKILGVLYGAPYQGGSSVLIVLCVSQLLCVMVGSSEHLAAMSGRQTVVLVSTFISAIISLSLTSLLLPRFGPPGAAAAAGLASLIFKMILSWYCRVQLGIRTWMVLGPTDPAGGATGESHSLLHHASVRKAEAS